MSEAVKRWRKRQRKKAIAYKGGVCIACGCNNQEVDLHFHHLEPDRKSFQISDGNCRSWERVRSELDKCVLLCSSCHISLHKGELSIQKYLSKDPHPSAGMDNVDQLEFVGGRERPNCVDCGELISHSSNRCRSCYYSSRERIDWPKIDDLIRMVKKWNFSKVGRDLGVSGNAIRKRIRNHSNFDPKDFTG